MTEISELIVEVLAKEQKPISTYRLRKLILAKYVEKPITLAWSTLITHSFKACDAGLIEHTLKKQTGLSKTIVHLWSIVVSQSPPIKMRGLNREVRE